MRCERNREHAYKEQAERKAVNDVAPVDLRHWASDERTEAMAQHEEADAEDGNFLAHMESSRHGKFHKCCHGGGSDEGSGGGGGSWCLCRKWWCQKSNVV